MSERSLLPVLRRPTPADRAIRDFQSETDEIVGQVYPWKARSTLYTCSLALVGALLLSATMTLDRVVVAPGRIVSQSPTILVQSLELSVVRTLMVRPGQVVRAGEPIAQLDSTFSAADAGRLQNQVNALTAEVQRLEAELEGRPFASAYLAGGQENSHAMLQAAIWQARKSEKESRIAGFNQRIMSAEAILERAKRDADHYRSRLGLTTEIEKMRAELERSQVGSRLQSLLASDARTEIARNLANSEDEMRTAAHDIEALRSEREAYVQQTRAEVVRDLVQKRSDLRTAEEEYSKAALRKNLVDLRAVEDAVVLSVADISVGSVVRPGDLIATMVPLGAAVEVEAEIAGPDQGFVKPGDPVQIKLAAYRFTEHGTAKGVLESISEDSFDRRDDGTPAPERFYRARIRITDVSTLRRLPEDFRLVPGMPLAADIVVGDRTILGFLTGRITTNFADGMREP